MCMSFASWFCCAIVREASLVRTSSRGLRGVEGPSSILMRLVCFPRVGQWRAMCPSCSQEKQVILVWVPVTA